MLTGHGASQSAVFRFQRPQHPYLKVKPLPDPSTLQPEWQNFLRLVDAQFDLVTRADFVHLRKTEFHTWADAHGNTFNQVAPAFAPSGRAVLLTWFALLLLGPIIFSILFGRRSSMVSRHAAASDPPREVQTQLEADSFPPIQWEAPSSASPIAVQPAASDASPPLAPIHPALSVQ